MEGLVFPLYHLPPFTYVQSMLGCKKVQISMSEPFQKQSLRSRFEIMSPNQRQVLSVPLQKGKSKCRMDEVKISYAEPWQRKHWQALETAYHNSPFFEYYGYQLKPVFMEQPVYLWQYNLKLLEMCKTLLKVDVAIEPTETLPNAFDTIEKTTIVPYDQVFADRHGFMENLSIVDWLFNVGANF